MVSDETAIAVSPRALHSELMCPICLDLMTYTLTTKEVRTADVDLAAWSGFIALLCMAWFVTLLCMVWYCDFALPAVFASVLPRLHHYSTSQWVSS